MSEPLLGKVVAIIGRGSPLERAFAVCVAEAGASIAIATWSPEREQEFATASIANEIWAIGREQFSHILDGFSETGVAAFGAETVARLGACHALVLMGWSPELPTVTGTLLPAFVRGAGRNVACLIVTQGIPASFNVVSEGSDPAAATAIVACLPS